MRYRQFILFFLAIFINVSIASGQKIKQENPVAFADFVFGHTWGKTGGFTGGVAINYQKEHNFFTFRFIDAFAIESRISSVILPIPSFEPRSEMTEFALLYGRRFIESNKAYSLSIGPSYSVFNEFIKGMPDDQFVKTRYAGAAFEVNIKWFKSEKAPYHIYGIIPVGRPTGFGNHIGFKFFGTIAKESYAGLGFSFGLGYHKQY